jgi:hypothetical protein
MLLKKTVVAERELLLFLFNIVDNGMNNITTTTDEPEMVGITHIKKQHCLSTCTQMLEDTPRLILCY